MAKYDNEDGYAYTDRLFKMIGEDANYELPLEEAVDYIKFYGLKDLMIAEGRIGFVGAVAMDRLNKALVWEDYILVKKETVTEFADRCRECGAYQGQILAKLMTRYKEENDERTSES